MKKLAKYQEIMQHFRSRIESGELKEGEFLPLEGEICAQFSASHMTVSRALGELTATGYLRRTPGVGTVVSSGYRTVIQKNMVVSESMTSLIEAAGLTPGAELLNYAVVQGKDVPDAAKALNIGEDAFLHYFVRARYGSGDLVCLSYSYISQLILPTIDVTRLMGSFDEYVKSLGIRRTHGSITYSAALPTPEQAKIIGSDHVPLLQQSILWYSGDRPFELTRHYFIGSKYTVTTERLRPDGDDSEEIFMLRPSGVGVPYACVALPEEN